MRARAGFLPTEAQLQDSIVDGLGRLGYTVLQIGRYTRQVRCNGCGAWFTPRTGYGNTPGELDEHKRALAAVRAERDKWHALSEGKQYCLVCGEPLRRDNPWQNYHGVCLPHAGLRESHAET